MTNRMRVLVADDDPEMLTAVADALTGIGLEVVRAGSGGDLMDQLASEGPFQLIVSDVSMPWMDGLKALHSIRTAGLSTPVIVMTALRDPRIQDSLRALGPRAMLLRKPFELDELHTAVRALLPRSPRVEDRVA
jgi:DNA-binding response OmpR family regulator